MLHILRSRVLELRNLAHTNCLEQQKQAFNQVLNILDEELKEENLHSFAKHVVESLGEYVNDLDKRDLGVPLMDEVAVMQMEDIVIQRVQKPESELERREY